MNVFACADSFLPCLVVITTSQGEFFLTLKTLWFAEEKTCSGKLAATAFSIHIYYKRQHIIVYHTALLTDSQSCNGAIYSLLVF